MSGPVEKLQRQSSPKLDDVLGEKFECLSDGFVRVVDYMGTDSRVVQAARVSYGKGTKTPSTDRTLIRYLMRHRHTTPFEQAHITLHIRCPMDVWRQWIRHRTANVNEYSTRYSVAIEAMEQTPANKWRIQDNKNRQGSAGVLPVRDGESFTEAERELHATVREEYENRLAAGIAREQARKDLPLSTYTEAYWTIDLHNLLHFLSLRMDEHAQLEIRTFATIIGSEIVSRWVPFTWGAFNDYRLKAIQFTMIEQTILQYLNLEMYTIVMDYVRGLGWLRRNEDGKLKRVRERVECETKFAKLGITCPWEDG